MKVLTVHQPFATYIMLGLKKLETRRWKPGCRGKLAIHAARNNPFPFLDKNHEALEAQGLPTDLDFPSGCILGTVILSECFSHLDLAGDGDLGRVVTPRERLIGNFGPGWYAWWLMGPIPLDEVIPCRGDIGLWEKDFSHLAFVGR